MTARYSIAVTVPAASIDRFAGALDPFAEAVAAFELAEHGAWCVEAQVAALPDPAALAAALALAAAAAGVAEPEPRIAPLAAVDWLAVSRAAERPQRVGRYFVHPSHHPGPPPDGTLAIRIDAGPAFGSGSHESTRGCLLALDRLARVRLAGGGRPRRVLDLGCGSGVLAIAVAKTWHVPVLAADIDPQAVATAAANARANAVRPWVRVVHSTGYAAPALRRAAPYDLILANILARPLVRLAGDAARHLSPGGYLVLSGLLVEQERAVLAAHQARGLQVRERIRLGAWATLVLKRTGRRR